VAKRERVLPAFVLTGSLVVVFAAWIAGGVGGETTMRYVDDIATAAAAAAATAFCVRAGMRYQGQLRLSWWLFAAACGAWALGELIWALYDLVLGTSVPVPSWADAAYLAAIPPTAAALLVHPAIRGRAIGKMRSLLDGLVIAAALLFIGWTLLLEPLWHTSDLSTLGGAVTLAYPLGDIVILLLITLVIRGTTGGDRLGLWCLLVGLLAITLSDSMYGYLTEVKNYATGDVIDTGWFAGYLGIALAAYFARSEAGSRRRVPASPSLTSAAVVTPFLPLFGALSLVAIRTELGHRLDRVALFMAFALVGLVLLRQVLLLADLIAPGRGQEAPLADRLVAAVEGASAHQGRESSPLLHRRTL